MQSTHANRNTRSESYEKVCSMQHFFFVVSCKKQQAFLLNVLFSFRHYAPVKKKNASHISFEQAHPKIAKPGWRFIPMQLFCSCAEYLIGFACKFTSSKKGNESQINRTPMFFAVFLKKCIMSRGWSTGVKRKSFTFSTIS